MNIAFDGAPRALTSTKHFITLKNNTPISVGCCLFQGMGDVTEKLNQGYEFNTEPAWSI
jgi:metallo-beta-lactamase family protein